MSISSTGLYGSAVLINSDLFQDVSDLKEEMVTLSTSYLQTTAEHIRMHICMCILYIYIYIGYVCMYVYVCVYIYTYYI